MIELFKQPTAQALYSKGTKLGLTTHFLPNLLSPLRFVTSISLGLFGSSNPATRPHAFPGTTYPGRCGSSRSPFLFSNRPGKREIFSPDPDLQFFLRAICVSVCMCTSAESCPSAFTCACTCMHAHVSVFLSAPRCMGSHIRVSISNSYVH